jgi:hypothetical protein
MAILPGGSILNSTLLSLEDQETVSAFNTTYKNFGLKAGIITKAYESDDGSNLSKIGPEYDVLVIEQDADRSISAIQYKNCIMAETFGNIADFFEFKLRAQTKQSGGSGRNPAKQNGALVLLLCLDGAAEKGIILKALKHPARKEILDKEKGLHMHGEFNGLNIKVDKDGAFKITFKGPRDDDGKYTNTEAGGSFVEINKDGQIDLNSGNDDYIRIDKKNKDIELNAGQHIGLTAKKNIELNADGNISLNAKKDFSFLAGGKANMKFESTLDLESGGAMSLKAASFKGTFDGAAKIQASQITLQGQTFLGGAGGSPAIVGTTQFLGTGNLGIPVISLAIGPFSSQVFIAP